MKALKCWRGNFLKAAFIKVRNCRWHFGKFDLYTWVWKIKWQLLNNVSCLFYILSEKTKKWTCLTNVKKFLITLLSYYHFDCYTWIFIPSNYLFVVIVTEIHNQQFCSPIYLKIFRMYTYNVRNYYYRKNFEGKIFCGFSHLKWWAIIISNNNHLT